MFRIKIIARGLAIALLISLFMLAASIGLSLLYTNVPPMEESYEKAIHFFVGMLGYSDLDSESIFIQLALAYGGVIAISFLSAYLTINLFVRDKLYFEGHVVLWERGIEKFASIGLINNGREIDNINVSMTTYIDKEVLETTSDDELNPGCMELPFLPKKGFWKLDIPLKSGSYLWKTLRKMDHKEFLIVIRVSYIDSYLGQQFTNIFQLTKEHIIGSTSKGGMICHKNKKTKTRIKYEKNTVLKNKITNAIQDTRVKIANYTDAQPIGGAMSITEDYLPGTDRRHTVATINWRNKVPQDSFAMACYKLLPAEDWREYYRKNGKIEFELLADENIRSVEFELKYIHENNLEVLFQETIPVDTCEIQFKSLSLHNGKNLDLYESVREICFLVYEKDLVDPKMEGVFEVFDLCISFDEPQEPDAE